MTGDQKLQRFSICGNFLQRENDDENLLKKKNIAGDEMWIYSHDAEIKQISSHWKCLASTRPKKARQVRPKVKSNAD
jgi:hypothetical protein